MPRFHFNVYDGKTYSDVEGTVLNDEDEARSEALRYAAQVLADDRGQFAFCFQWGLIVTNEANSVLFTIDFSLTPAPLLQAALQRAKGSLPAEPTY